MSKSEKSPLGNVVEALADSFDKELFATPQEGLDRYWHFKWSPEASDEKNLYHFYDMLELYSNHCRRWEEHHNGHVCIVSRVRDLYLMPKIKAFLAELSARGEQAK